MQFLIPSVQYQFLCLDFKDSLQMDIHTAHIWLGNLVELDISPWE